MFGKAKKFPCLCSCGVKRREEEKERFQNMNKQKRLERIIDNSLMDEQFKTCTFENWDHKLGNEKMFKIGKGYADNFQKCKNKNTGLLIYGAPGNGKTFLSACITNELMKKLIPVVCVSVIALLQRIQKTFNKFEKEEAETVLSSLDNADLLILDDLGTENMSEWSVSMIYHIIDSRARLKKPLIITTNIDLEEIKERYDKRTYDRITELCTQIKNEGSSIRQIKGKSKAKEFKEILGL